MKHIISSALLLGFTVVVAGCSLSGNKILDFKEAVIAEKVLTASGQSQFDQYSAINKLQRRFSAEQSAKLNAYRQLAAMLYQEKLPGGLTVAVRVMKNEAYRLYFDLYLREAKVVKWQTLGSTLNTTMALTVSDRFFRCIAGDETYLRQCLQEDQKMPFTRLGYKTAEIKTVNLACGSTDCGGQLHVGGFSQGNNALDNGLLSAGLYDTEWILNTSSRLFINYLLLNGIPK